MFYTISLPLSFSLAGWNSRVCWIVQHCVVAVYKTTWMRTPTDQYMIGASCNELPTKVSIWVSCNFENTVLKSQLSVLVKSENQNHASVDKIVVVSSTNYQRDRQSNLNLSDEEERICLTHQSWVNQNSLEQNHRWSHFPGKVKRRIQQLTRWWGQRWFVRCFCVGRAHGHGLRQL